MEKFSYGENHPMQPIRAAMTFDLLKSQGILDKFDIYKTVPCSNTDLLTYHSPSYVSYMEKYEKVQKPLPQFKIGLCSDVPAFENFFEYSKTVGGSSLLGATLIQ